MPIREFTDSKNVTWRVWTTKPGNANVVSAEYRDGWLTFDCGPVRRRLAPIPARWEEMSPERLELLCRMAKQTPTSDPHGIPAQPRDDKDRGA